MAAPEAIARIDLRDQVGIVTGGNRGIGRATAITLAQHGVNVVIGYSGRTRESVMQARDTVKLIKSYGVVGLAVRGDVARPATSERIVQSALDMFGKIDILVPNAGMTDVDLMQRMTGDRWRSLVNTNLNAVYDVVHAALPAMNRKRYGRVVGISSILAHGGPGAGPYAASKGGVESFMQAMAVEAVNEKRDLRFNTVAPGFVDTDMTKDMSEEHKQGILQQTPIGRVIEAQEVANTVLFLVSPMASGINGAVIPVNGGLLRG